MKKIIIAFISVFTFMSCLPDAEWSQTVPITADFEFTDIEYDADSLYFMPENGSGFGYTVLGFCNKVDTVKRVFEGGMLLSCQKGRLYDPADSVALAKSETLVFEQDRFRVNSLKDTISNNTYTVYYANPEEGKMPDHDFVFTIKENGTCVVYQCLINNTAYVAYKVANTFKPGDKLTLKATGYLKGAKTKDVSMTLADFSAQKDSIVSKWTVFDLSPLGSIDCIDFDIESTKKDVPAYFCMDIMEASVTISSGL